LPRYKTKLFIFRRIKFRIVSLFVLVAIIMVLFTGVFLFRQVSNLYYRNFIAEIDAALSASLSEPLLYAMQSGKPVDTLSDILHTQSGILGLDFHRHAVIINASGSIVWPKAAEPFAGSFSVPAESQNLVAAFKGEIGKNIYKKQPYMDYAYPLIQQSAVKYILYIQDDKAELNHVMQRLFYILLQALGASILITLLFGLWISEKISKPITTVTKKVQRIASGDFDQQIEVKTKDEIGKLTSSFNYMANELRATVEEMEREKNKMETILHNMADGVIAFDSDGNIIHINPAAIEMFGIQEPRHRTFDDIFSEIDDGLTLYDLLYLKPDKTQERQFYQNDRYIKALFAPFNTDQYKAAGVIVVLQDFTMAQKLSDSRREFVANVSHELKTPITTIKTYVETILESELENKNTTMQFLKVIHVETDRMTRLIKDLLMLSRFDYSDEVIRRKLSIDRLVRGVLSKFSLEASQAGLTVSYHPSERLPAYYGDRDRLEQVISNILSNAIKYTPHGGKVDVSTFSQNDVIYIRISDTGIGIPKKDLSRIFERFYRVDKARSREHGGTGLGLAIAKEIVQKFGGDITIQSEVGTGTDVLISLPLIY
jgi:two-component system sensor histidine kinase VicK